MGSEEIGLNEYFDEMDRVQSVIGGASGSECTYDKGYLSRQAIYSCLDCTPSSSNIQAGFCHACAVNCHREHSVEEIYTKRNFRCDCGTLPQLLCSLKPDVDVRNTDNLYSQNFAGLYCQCARPYPDEERPEMDTVEMIQCFMCEDWFHTTHLNTVVPEKYEEMACVACVGKHPFLSVYALPEVENVDIEGPAVQNISAIDTQGTDKSNASVLTKSEIPSDDKISKSEKVSETNSAPDIPIMSPDDDLKRPPSSPVSCEPLSKRKKTEATVNCKLDGKNASTFAVLTRALFFDERLRHSVCKCQQCLDVYKERNISYITVPEDSLSKYEEKAQASRQQEEAEFSETLEGLPHQAKCDVARAIGSLKDVLHGLISKSVTGGKVGRDEIVEAFKTMAAETKSVDPSVFDRVGK